jgi:replicative DNA helicase
VTAELRVAPFDDPAERAVLSAILLERHAMDDVALHLSPEHFYREAHRRIFEAMVALQKKGHEIDLVSLSGELADRERLAQVGGQAYLAEIIDAVPSIANVDAYAIRVRDKWRLRQLIAQCQQIAAEGYGDVGDIEAFIDAAEGEIAKATSVATVSDEKTLGECAREAYTEIAEASERGSGLVGDPTGLSELDPVLGGLRMGKLTILAACPGVGKSMLAQSIAIGVATASKGAVGVSVFTPEMTAEELGERAIASASDLDAMLFRYKMAPAEWGAIHRAMGELDTLPIWVTDDAEVTTMKMRARVRRRQQKFADASGGRGRIGLVVLDYLQLMNTGRSKGESREEAVTRVAGELKVLAKTLRVHVLAISSLNRAIATRLDKRPVLSDLRESGAIEYHADNILFLYRESYYDPTCKNPNLCELNVAKQRGGMTGVVKLAFDKRKSRFRDAAPSEAWQQAPRAAGVRVTERIDERGRALPDATYSGDGPEHWSETRERGDRVPGRVTEGEGRGL